MFPYTLYIHQGSNIGTTIIFSSLYQAEPDELWLVALEKTSVLRLGKTHMETHSWGRCGGEGGRFGTDFGNLVMFGVSCDVFCC